MSSLPPHQAVVIGTSAGALEALTALLPILPDDFPAPVAVVVHLPPDQDNVMPELLQQVCRLPVREAEDKEPLEPATIYLAPPNYHLLIETDGSFSLSNDEPVLFSRPSIDVLFESAADAYEDNLTGIILTGANNDGAHGLASIARGNGQTIVQNPAEARASAMPRAAIEACPQARVLPLEGIATHLIATIHAKKGN